MRRLLRGVEPVCATCYRVLEPGEAKVTVPSPANPRAPFWRCGDCEYRSVYG